MKNVDERKRLLDESPSSLSVKGTKISPGKKNFTVKRIRKNILAISFVFLLCDLGVFNLFSLQSSLFIDEGLGVIAQAIFHATQALSCFILPPIMIDKIGHKWTVSIALVGFFLWMVANGYAVWGTMIPASIVGGLGAGLARVAAYSYCARLAFERAKLQNEKLTDVMSYFFGIYIGISKSSLFIGAAISATVLNPRQVNVSSPSAEETMLCGMNDCPSENKTNVNFNQPAQHLVLTLLLVYIACVIAALLICIFFVDSLSQYSRSDSSTKHKKTVLNLLCITSKQLSQLNQWLLIFIILFNGMSMGFMQSDYTKSWVTCYVGIWWIGWVMIPLFGCSIIGSLITGRLTKYTGRLPTVVAGFLLVLVATLTLIFWKPTTDDVPIFFFIPALWGISGVIFLTQIRALIGILFSRESEAAYSIYQFIESIGMTTAFAYGASLCTSVKLYILLTVFLAGMIGYLIIEIPLLWKQNRKVSAKLQLKN